MITTEMVAEINKDGVVKIKYYKDGTSSCPKCGGRRGFWETEYEMDCFECRLKVATDHIKKN